MNGRLLFGVFLCSAAFAQQPVAIAIKGARIVTVSGADIETGTVVIRNGLIEAVGTSVPEPPGAWVMDGAGLTVYPGLIDALSSWGMPEPPRPSGPPPVSRGPEDRPMTFSHERAADLLLANDRKILAARNAGFTGAVAFPDRGIFGGHGAVINLAGTKPDEMVVEPSAGMHLALRQNPGGFPSSLMGTIAYIRQMYLDAAHSRMAQEFYAAQPVGNKRPVYDRTLERLSAPRVLLPANDPKEAERMLRLAEELQLKPVLYGMMQGYRTVEILQKAKVPVLVNLHWPEKPRSADPDAEDSLRVLDIRDRAPSTPGELAKAGVPFAFYTKELERPRDYAAAVRKAIDAGLAPATAIRALTLSVAEIYGVANRLGSIEKGKIANLVVTKGDLFRTQSEIKYVFIDGIKYDPQPEPNQ